MTQTKNKYILSLSIFAVLFLLAVCVCVTSYSSPFVKYSGGVDTNVFKYIAKVIAEGGMPYKDSFDHKGPLLYLIDLIGIIITENLYGVWIFEIIAIGLTFCILYEISCLFVSWIPSLVTTIVATAELWGIYGSGNYSELFAIPCIAMSTYTFLEYYTKGKTSKLKLILCGFSCGVVLMLRANMVALWIVFIPFIVCTNLIQKRSMELLQYVLYFTVGLLTIILPVLIWICLNGAWSDFVFQYFTFNFLYSTDPERASLVNKLTSAAFFLTKPLMSFSFAVMMLTVVKEKRVQDVAYIFYMILTVYLTSMSGQTYGHYSYVMIPLYGYPIVMFFNLWKSINKKIVRVFFILVLLLLEFSAAMQWVSGLRKTYSLFAERNLNENLESDLYNIVQVIREESTDNEEISVYGNRDSVYLYSNRKSASKYSYQFPIGTVNTDILDEYFQEIDVKRPKLIVVVNDMFDGNRVQDPRMLAFLDDNGYQEIYADSSNRIFKYGD